MFKRLVKFFLLFVIILAVLCGIYFGYKAYKADNNTAEVFSEGENFDYQTLMYRAKQLSNEGYQKPEANLLPQIKNLSYDEHRDIRFVRENGPWFGKRLPFEVQFFHLGSIFETPVSINEIVNGKSHPIKFSSNFFDYGKNNLGNLDLDDLGYAGFRLHYPLNSPIYYDELVSFLGASYFRALGQGQKYGLSARGLAIDTALQKGEEFPIFKEFWLERPSRKYQSIKIYALLDSPSVTGAYSFVITPGKNTTMDVNATLFPRKNIEKLGVAPLTSMFLFGENTKNRFDDHRPEVHDSDGLLVWNGNDEWLWRPLDNSKYLRISSFVDNNPKGFGLMQRDKNPEHYLDFEAFYEDRPSVWVEVLGDWGKGMIQLVEIPSIQEIHDNIVAFWVPNEPILAGKMYNFKYRLSWCNEVPDKPKEIAKVTSTYTGIGGVSGMLEVQKRKFAIDFKAPNLKSAIEKEEIKAEVSISEGKIVGTHLMYNPVTKGATVYVDFLPPNKAAEIRVSLKKDDKTISEVWSYQWLP